MDIPFTSHVSLANLGAPLHDQAADKALGLLKSSPESALSDLHEGEHSRLAFLTGSASAES